MMLVRKTHQQSQPSSQRRPHRNLFISCCSVSCVVTACLPHNILKQDEKQVSGKQATDPTPKQWNAAKALRQEPDIPAHVLVWRKRMQGRYQVAQIVDFPAEQCTCQRFFNVLAAPSVPCSRQISATLSNWLWAILKRWRASQWKTYTCHTSQYTFGKKTKTSSLHTLIFIC